MMQSDDRRSPEQVTVPGGRRAVDKLECPYCHTLGSKVVDSRAGRSSSGYWRRRECLHCKRRFTTEEVIRGKYEVA